MRETGNPAFEHEPRAGGAEPSVTETRKLRKTGNSYGVTLSRRALDAAGFSPDEPVSISVTAGCVTIRAVGGDYDATVEAGREALAQYRFALERLGR
ncbi:hypothetical protein L2D00_10060 [Hyphomonadaceae bacterium BL14]|nr:hypothetical protein L2D00_10060 [Hyphomonadaceae bacterium BL14]